MDPIIGKAIKDGLRRKGQTQRWLAEQAEVSDNAVSKWIKTGQIAREYAALVCRELDIPAEVMLRIIDGLNKPEKAKSGKTADEGPPHKLTPVEIARRLSVLEDIVTAGARSAGVPLQAVVVDLDGMRQRVRQALSGEAAASDDEPDELDGEAQDVQIGPPTEDRRTAKKDRRRN